MKLSEVTLRVHEGMHGNRSSVVLREGGKALLVRVHPVFGVPYVRHVAISKDGEREYEWIAQDNEPRFGDDRLLAKLVSFGHQITRVKISRMERDRYNRKVPRTEMLKAGVVDGVWTEDLESYCTEMVRRVLNPADRS